MTPTLPRWPACLLLCLTLLLAQPASAVCFVTAKAVTTPEAAAAIPFGRINLEDAALQPVGTLLASVAVPPSNYTYGGAHADTPLWNCHETDVQKDLHFLVSVNADSRFGGAVEIEESHVGVDGVHATWFNEVGLRLSVDGVVLNGKWKRVPLKTWAPDPTNKNRIVIRLQDVPTLQAELYRVDRQVPKAPGAWACGGKQQPPSTTGTAYNCLEPSAYIQLSGPTIVPLGWADREGEEHHTHFKFWGQYNGFGYTLYNALTLSATPSCVVHNHTPEVRFATTSVEALKTGSKVPANFSVELDCSDSAISNDSQQQPIIGLQTSYKAYLAAKNLKLVNPNNGVEYLVSDDDASGTDLAKGVGIRLSAGGEERVFVGHPGTIGDKSDGPSAGWYPASQGVSNMGETSSGRRRMRLDFTATLEKLPQAQSVTPGKVHATAHVLVKVGYWPPCSPAPPPARE